MELFRTALFVFAWVTLSHAGELLPDEPEVPHTLSLPSQTIDSYTQALRIWKTAADINAWVAKNFRYDRVRAVELSSDKKIKDKRLPVYAPSKLFDLKSGCCVDLARFGVETLNIIDPGSDSKYLMVEFDPIHINGNTFRLHWLATFEKDGLKYFFCDSKRPGFMAGPYASTEVFIREYEQYRDRKVILYRELASYKKEKRTLERKKARKAW